MGTNSNESRVRRGYSATGDRGLNAYIQKVYVFMTLGLGVSGLVAYLASTSQPLMHAIYGTGLFWLVVFAPLVLVAVLSGAIAKMSAETAFVIFVLYAASIGLSISSIFIRYTDHSIVSVFLIVMSIFACMSIYGYSSKKDLTSMGAFFRMGLWGLIISMVVNLFLRSSALSFALSAVAVVVFTGLTAYDVQKVRLSYDQSDNQDVVTKKAIFGALTLYLDFVNLFIHLLRLVGNRK
jgi:FtsH-binding integral membrane protein